MLWAVKSSRKERARKKEGANGFDGHQSMKQYTGNPKPQQ